MVNIIVYSIVIGRLTTHNWAEMEKIHVGNGLHFTQRRGLKQPSPKGTLSLIRLNVAFGHFGFGILCYILVI